MSLFSLPPELEELRGSIRRLADEKIAPHAARADAEADYPTESWQAWQEAGFAGLAFPEEYGGQDAGLLAHSIAVEEVARVCASSSLFTFISKLGMSTVIKHGSDELKAKALPPICAGDSQASYCLSEAGAGSDVSAMTTRADKSGDGYVLTGSKMWITNAGISDTYTVFAKTDPEAGHRGISAFVVKSEMEGFSIGKLEDKMGVRGSPTGEVILDGVEVPEENLIGEEGQGFYYAMGALDGSRPLVGAQAIGIAQGALETAGAYVSERSQFGQKIAEFQGIQFMLADMASALEGARLLVYRAGAAIDEGETNTAKSSAMAKLAASEAAMSITTDVVQLLGGVGYTKEFPAERMMRDAKITQIYEGTNQIQRMVIGRSVIDEYSQ